MNGGYRKMAKETKRIVGGTVREVTTTEQAQSSVELSRNAKGEYAFSIKLYFTDDQEPDVVRRISVLHDELTELYAPGGVRVKLQPAKEA